MGFMFPANGNLGRFGNSAAWWLGIQPYELFFYVFLPPLLLDAAVRIDFFLFKKVRPILQANKPGSMSLLLLSCHSTAAAAGHRRAHQITPSVGGAVYVLQREL